jgi:hypothetical protein
MTVETGTIGASLLRGWRLRRCAMPWPEITPMHECVPLIAASLRQGSPMTARWERFGIRRNTGETWGRRDTTSLP